MPTLLQINSVVNIASTGRIVEQLGHHALSKGWDSYIAYGRTSNASESKTIKIGNEAEVALHGIQSRLFDSHGLGSARATKSFIAKIREINPDIIHLHNIHGYYINYPILFNYLSKSNIPVVWTLHDCWAFTGHCSHFSDINCVKWKSECNHCPKIKNYPASFFIDHSRKNYKRKSHLFTSLNKMTIVPVSKWLGGIVQESYLSEYPIQIINNGIDINEFYPLPESSEVRTKYRITEKFMLLGVATAWNSGKGLNDYFKLRQVLSDDYTIVLVGLTKKQKELLPPGIIGIERTNDVKELAALYSAADIILNLSYQETFGMTTVEGFSCGTPGIVYNSTASPELITPQTGLIVEPGNIKQLVDAIKTITNNGRKYYSANCRKRAEIYYNKDDRYDEYIQLYGKLLSKVDV
jgi:glycosyltransferase involved in cell wall biosynthesis